ncbi:hypothetical protein [Microbacterium sp.]|uniref:hypothetical protein n=1 Tax=Microbacterium sp. TaxID=51671 RepID=UPI003FA5415D
MNDDMRTTGLSHLTAVSGDTDREGGGRAQPVTRAGQGESRSVEVGTRIGAVQLGKLRDADT